MGPNQRKPNAQIQKFAVDTDRALFGGQFAPLHFHVDPHSLRAAPGT